jgi:hypothetical protein
MAIVACPECGKEVSDTASACPSCGAPVVRMLRARLGIALLSDAWKRARPYVLRPWTLTVSASAIALLAAVLVYDFVSDRQEQARQEEEIARLPEMPLRVRFINDASGLGVFVLIDNTSGEQIWLMASASNERTKGSKSFDFFVEPRETTEVGHHGGWTFTSGDSLSFINLGYRPLYVRIP